MIGSPSTSERDVLASVAGVHDLLAPIYLSLPSALPLLGWGGRFGAQRGCITAGQQLRAPALGAWTCEGSRHQVCTPLL